MNAHPLSRLTEKQRECLRLVYAHMSSKEIAQQLGVEPGTVDQYIKAAMRILGVADRRAAARMLAEYGGDAAQPALAMREAQEGFEAAIPRDGPPLPLPLKGMRPTHVGPGKRLAWIVMITVGIALAFLILLAIAEAFERLWLI